MTGITGTNHDATESRPWENEPDKLEWTTSAGYAAEIRRHPSINHLCGYVGISSSHPLFGIGCLEPVPQLTAAPERRKQQPLGDAPAFSIMVAVAFGGGIEPRVDTVLNVHGGITFSGQLRDADTSLWWFGFDCGHCDDLSPGLIKYGHMPNEVYRDVEFVRRETESLAQQLSTIVSDLT